LLSRSASSYSDIVAEVNTAGGNAIGFAADVTDLASLKSVFADIKKEVGDKHLAAAVYNVGGGFVRKPFLELTPEEFTAGWESNG
jgi:enoyl-[acyl-carrier-protein] reductase (NADH)